MNILDKLISRFPDLSVCREDIQAANDIICNTYKNGGKVLVCGNGGSAADSEHIVGELMKGFMLRRPISGAEREKILKTSPSNGEYITKNLQGALPAISLVSHSALISAFSNDVAPDMVFAQQVFGYGTPNDTLIAISTSGNSKNVIYAIEVAASKSMKTIGLTGMSGGAMKGLCDTTIAVPSAITPEIQEYHLPIYHALCMMVEAYFFSE